MLRENEGCALETPPRPVGERGSLLQRRKTQLFPIKSWNDECRDGKTIHAKETGRRADLAGAPPKSTACAAAPVDAAWTLLQGVLERVEKPGQSCLHKAIAVRLCTLGCALPVWLETSFKKVRIPDQSDFKRMIEPINFPFRETPLSSSVSSCPLVTWRRPLC